MRFVYRYLIEDGPTQFEDDWGKESESGVIVDLQNSPAISKILEEPSDDVSDNDSAYSFDGKGNINYGNDNVLIHQLNIGAEELAEMTPEQRKTFKEKVKTMFNHLIVKKGLYSCPAGLTMTRVKWPYFNGCGPGTGLDPDWQKEKAAARFRGIAANYPQLQQCCDYHDVLYGSCGTSQEFADTLANNCWKHVCEERGGIDEHLQKTAHKQCGIFRKAAYNLVRSRSGTKAHGGTQQRVCSCVDPKDASIVRQGTLDQCNDVQKNSNGTCECRATKDTISHVPKSQCKDNDTHSMVWNRAFPQVSTDVNIISGPYQGETGVVVGASELFVPQDKTITKDGKIVYLDGRNNKYDYPVYVDFKKLGGVPVKINGEIPFISIQYVWRLSWAEAK